MLIAHLPAGYVLAAKLRKYSGNDACFWPVIIGSVFPDLDMLWFYFVDHGRVLHHRYLFHQPVYWALTGVIALVVLAAAKKSREAIRLSWLLTGALLHLLLDTIVGKIDWLYPLSRQSYALFEVPAKYGWWVWNFVFHWTFLLEIALIAWAIIILVRPSQDSRG
ncbi:MAG: metal-dependent hydrolase [Elusimicrobia bacterium]|nr:metal-dependent hydrolase [Elusimicrobiota bacterium]